MGDKIPLVDAQEINEVSTVQNHEWIVKFEENFWKFESDHQEKQQQEKKKQPKKRENINIHKVPADIRKNFDDLYAPCKVSFGPYHHERACCQSTEAIKERVVCHSLVTSKKKIHDYVNVLREDLKDLKDKYVDLDRKWQEDDEAFLRLMIYDGCFLLEIVREADRFDLLDRLYYGYLMDLDNSTWEIDLMGFDNPIWHIDEISRNKLMGYYRQDMVLLENQLPMLVLQKLFAVQTGEPIEEAKDNLHGRIFQFFFQRPRFTRERDMVNMPHVLQLFQRGLLYDEEYFGNTFWLDSDTSGYLNLTMILLPFRIICALVIELVSRTMRCLKESLRCPFQTSLAPDAHFSFPSARELHRVGIRFTTSKTRYLNDISFKGRTLRLPRIFVDAGTKSMFLNIIALEQSSPTQEVSWYIYFMSMLIQGEDDVCLLQSCDIINIMLISPNEVAELFNTLTKVIVLDPEDFIDDDNEYYYAGTMMRKRYNKMSSEWRRDLRQNYLKSPWAIVSVIAGFLLFGLTAVQTGYTVLGYYNPK